MNIIGAVCKFRGNRGTRWIEKLPAPPVDEPIKYVRVRSYSLLIPMPDNDGALLAWGFDVEPHATSTLVVRLSEREAQSVFEADPYSVGALEPVRRRLREPWAVMTVRTGGESYMRPFKISRFSSEAAFVRMLDEAAAGCPAFRLDGLGSVSPDVRKTVEGLDGLVFA